jgi:hypothetical protein
MDLPLQAARDRRLRNAVDLFQAPLEDVLRHLLQLPEVGALRRSGQRHHRLAGRIGAQDGRPRRTLRQVVTHVVQPLPHVQRRVVHVGAPEELELDLRGTLAADRVDRLHTRHPRDGPLDRFGDEALHLGGPCLGVLGPDGEGRKGDVGEQVDREARERDHAQQDDGKERHRRGHGSSYREIRQRHRLLTRVSAGSYGQPLQTTLTAHRGTPIGRPTAPCSCANDFTNS